MNRSIIGHFTCGTYAPTGSDSAEVVAGGRVQLQVDGDPASAVQWQKDGLDIPGANSSVLEIPKVAETDAGRYSARVTEMDGAVSEIHAVTLTISKHFTFHP